tara:strand:+ start:105 stop:275 length:171 start_codon:yes stop_codon:yes gene_type:complete
MDIMRYTKGFQFLIGKKTFTLVKVKDEIVWFANANDTYSCHDYEFEEFVLGKKILY